MPDIDGNSLADIAVQGNNCPKKVYVLKAAFGRKSEINTSAGTTVASGEITALAMQTGKEMYAITAPTKNVTWNFQYTSDQGTYIAPLVVNWGAIHKTILAAINTAENHCDLFAYVELSDGQLFFLGLDVKNDAIEQYFDCEINDHSGSVGGGNDSSNAATFNFETFAPAVPTTVTYANIPLTPAV